MKPILPALVLTLVAGVSRRFTVSLVGENLLSPQAEFAGVGAIVTPTRIPRSARVELTWRH
jgi:hypothetical protein